MRRLTIGELAKRAGVSVETVRYYQRRKLLPLPPRRRRGFREYGPEALDLLRFIRRAKSLGFSLKEIAEWIGMRDARRVTCETVRARLSTKMAEIDAKVRTLLITRAGLERLLGACESELPHRGACMTWEAVFTGTEEV